MSAAVEHDAFLVTCASRVLLARLADKWVTLILCALATSPARHSALARRITGVSQKMLTQTLRNLERDGLVDRTVTPTVPITVEYSLTPLGRSLVDVFLELKTWADTNIDEVEDAQRSYDARYDGNPIAGHPTDSHRIQSELSTQGNPDGSAAARARSTSLS